MPRSAWLVLVLLLTGCGDPPPRRIPPYHPVSLGEGELTVGYSEFHASGAKMSVQVHFRWTGPPQDLMPGLFRDRGLKMFLYDSAGRKFPPRRPSWSPIDPAPEEVFLILTQLERLRANPRANPIALREAEARHERIGQMEREWKQGRYPRDWVQCFELPLESRQLTLRAINPRPCCGQPYSVEVVLGR